MATRSRDELLEEVSAKEDSAKSQLRAEKTAATVTMETLSALVSRAARVTGKDPDVVSLRNELRAALLSEDRLDHHRQRANRQEPLWGWMYDVTEASVLQLEVVQATWGGWWRGAVLTSPGPVSERAGGQGGPLDERDDRNQQQRHCNTKNITANTTDITANTNNITANATNITANTNSITANATNITSLTDDMTTVKKDGTELKKTTSSLEEKWVSNFDLVLISLALNYVAYHFKCCFVA